MGAFLYLILQVITTHPLHPYSMRAPQQVWSQAVREETSRTSTEGTLSQGASASHSAGPNRC